MRNHHHHDCFILQKSETLYRCGGTRHKSSIQDNDLRKKSTRDGLLHFGRFLISFPHMAASLSGVTFQHIPVCISSASNSWVYTENRLFKSDLLFLSKFDHLSSSSTILCFAFSWSASHPPIASFSLNFSCPDAYPYRVQPKGRHEEKIMTHSSGGGPVQLDRTCHITKSVATFISRWHNICITQHKSKGLLSTLTTLWFQPKQVCLEICSVRLFLFISIFWCMMITYRPMDFNHLSR